MSCFYEIKTTGEFKQPIKLCLRHNVKLTSQENCKQLAFIRAKGPSPYKFGILPFDTTNQEFKVNDNYGIIKIADFSRLDIVWQRIVLPVVTMFKGPTCCYIIAVFFKQMEESCWEIQAVVTRDLPPFLEIGSHHTKIHLKL